LKCYVFFFAVFLVTEAAVFFVWSDSFTAFTAWFVVVLRIPYAELAVSFDVGVFASKKCAWTKK
jgi:hypothetical protein